MKGTNSPSFCQVAGDYIIPHHCRDYAAKFGDYWGQPCKLAYDKAAGGSLLWVDSQHNDTNSTSSFLGRNGVGYVAAPWKFLSIGVKSYQGRLRYRYSKAAAPPQSCLPGRLHARGWMGVGVPCGGRRAETLLQGH